jgi:hypothetical protein
VVRISQGWSGLVRIGQYWLGRRTGPGVNQCLIQIKFLNTIKFSFSIKIVEALIFNEITEDFNFQIEYTRKVGLIYLFPTFAVPIQKWVGHEVEANATLHGELSDGVMVTQQILVLSFKVRALVGQL